MSFAGIRPWPAAAGLYAILQAPSATHAPHSANVTVARPAANGLSMVTLRCGPSSGLRSNSLDGEPIVNSPGGITTISGQVSHSLNTSFGFSAHSSTAERAVVVREDTVNGVVEGALQPGSSRAGGRTTATLS